MPFRLEKLIKDLLDAQEYSTVDGILDYLDIEGSCNCFNDLIDISQLCGKYYEKLTNLGWYRKRLIDHIYKERGEDGRNLIEKVMK